MIFTVGVPEIKVKPIGGSVWESRAAVESYLARIEHPERYKIFGVAARWALDTQPVDGGVWHHLLIDCICISLD